MVLISATLASGQYVDALVQLPDAPVPGQSFSIRVLMNGANALQVEAVEPQYEGSARYLGADVRPLQQADGPAASVEYHFLALDEGSLVISSLSVLYDNSPIQLGSWHIAVGVAGNDFAGSGSQAGRGARLASWVAPESVRMYEAFLAQAVTIDDSPVVVRSLAVPGAVTRPSNGRQGWTVIATREGDLNLPALDLDTPVGKVRVAARRVRVQALPRAAALTRAVGTWSVSLKVELAGGSARPGDSASWEAIARGDGSAGFAEPPTVRVFGPDGLPVPPQAEPFRFGQATPGRVGFSGHAGAIGTILLELPGKYRIELEPYPWFDPVSMQLRYARAAPVVIQVKEPERPGWQPPMGLKSQAVATIHRLAATEGGLWIQALEAIQRDDQEEVSLVYDKLADSRPGSSGNRLPWGFMGPGGLDEGFAALAFLGSDPLTAFHESARLERWSALPGKVRSFADAAATAMDAPKRTRAMMPAPMVLWPAVAFTVLLACILLLSPFRHVSLLRLAGFMMVGVALLFSVVLALSILERGTVYFVSTGGSAMTVPSTAASVSFQVRSGSVGTVLQRIPLWVFVEFHDGRNAWLPESEICFY